ncbi:MAG: hypothetical protein ACI4KH_02125 [Oscillospiraceae bacterium]
MKTHKARNIIIIITGIVIICGIVFLPSFLMNIYFPKNSRTTVSEFDENEVTDIIKTYGLNDKSDFEIISVTEDVGRHRTYYTLKVKTDFGADIIDEKSLIWYCVLQDDGIRGLHTEEWWTPMLYYKDTEAYLVTCADVPESLSGELVTYCNSIEKLFDKLYSRQT